MNAFNQTFQKQGCAKSFGSRFKDICNEAAIARG